MIIYSGSSGLNIKVDPVRQRFSPKTGISDLSKAVNITIDPTGRISRQKGYDEILSGSFQSLCPFDIGGYTAAIEGTNLVAIDLDGGKVVMRNNMTPARVDYVMINDGLRDIVYYLNGYERGKIYGKESYQWNVTAYVGPTTDEEYEDPPTGHLICLYNGRIYIAVDNMIYGSLHHDYNKFIFSDNGMMFPGRVSMMRPVSDGIYVSAGETAFLSGQDMSPIGDWQPFSYIKKWPKDVIQGIHEYVDAQYVGVDASGEGILCYNDDGIFWAGPGGAFINITRQTLSSRHGDSFLPSGIIGAGIVIDNEHLILTVES